jgi:hypothetical protein
MQMTDDDKEFLQALVSRSPSFSTDPIKQYYIIKQWNQYILFAECITPNKAYFVSIRACINEQYIDYLPPRIADMQLQIQMEINAMNDMFSSDDSDEKMI